MNLLQKRLAAAKANAKANSGEVAPTNVADAAPTNVTAKPMSVQDKLAAMKAKSELRSSAMVAVLNHSHVSAPTGTESISEGTRADMNALLDTNTGPQVGNQAEELKAELQRANSALVSAKAELIEMTASLAAANKQIETLETQLTLANAQADTELLKIVSRMDIVEEMQQRLVVKLGLDDVE